jgi:hypothetical protein
MSSKKKLTNEEILKQGVRLLDSLLAKAGRNPKNDLKISANKQEIAGKFSGRRVKMETYLREASIVFLDFWPPETVQSNWDDLLSWVKNRP